jgi:ssDNA-binding Zn-finger/Zn-ribbon topoisomerase 1
MNAAIDLSCGECGAPMVLRNSRFGLFYGCSIYPKCKGTHGAHPDGRPLGKPANKATKGARMKAHAAFDQLWKGKGKRSRRSAYKWLREQPTLPDHIGEMTAKQCATLIELVEWELRVPTNLKTKHRR